MAKWIISCVLVFVLGSFFAAYRAGDIANFSRFIAISAHAEPECQATVVVDEMLSGSDTERTYRRNAALIVVGLRFDAYDQVQDGRIRKNLLRRLWSRMFVTDDELLRAFCALGNAGGKPKNMPALARIITAHELSTLDRTQLEAIVVIYFHDLGAPLTIPKLRRRFKERLHFSSNT